MNEDRSANRYVSLTTYNGEMYALTEDGRIYKIAFDLATGRVTWITHMHQLPIFAPYKD
jgi:hypothetical protein